MPFDSVSLDDKYVAESGRVFITGTQALVRLPLDQRRRDAAAGLNTAGYVSGYRGSPLGNYDKALWGAKKMLAGAGVHFQPGVNEELAATACWGTQQVTLRPNARHDGVFALWYGKGPGVDRAGDALKHANLAGTSPHGGVLALAGDDHAAKSSTTAHQSEQALAAAMIPILFPASVQDYHDLGLHGLALSRFAGVWVGFKCLTEIIESGSVIEVGDDRVQPILPEVAQPSDGLHIKWRFTPLPEEDSLVNFRLPAAQAYVRANGLDRVTHDAPRRTLGVITAGKSFADLRQAFEDLGLDAAQPGALGIRVLKLALTWPVVPETVRSFAEGHEEVLVIEEKRAFIEDQVGRLLYPLPSESRPRLAGKVTPEGAPLLPATYELSPLLIARALVRRLEAMGLADEALKARMGELEAMAARSGELSGAGPEVVRAPAFCSGCPHNTSTRLPEGSEGLTGIGCHTMALYVPGRPHGPPIQMGGEGANWVGMAPFTDTPHIFQNLGDGTYFHSGLIAVRAAVAAGVNITYKILYNDAVAMTGGQPVDGVLTPPQIAAQLIAEGVKRVVMVTDELERYRGVTLPDGVDLFHRDELMGVQKQLREMPGCTAMIYDQTCAAEKRRRRKKNEFPDPPKRMFINPAVCEGCGDCSKQSNCVSILPLETEFGRKRQIDQSSCNKDYSCVKGFCPSFVTVHGGTLKKAEAAGAKTEDVLAGVPAPAQPDLTRSYDVLVTGIGGTGVVTIGAVLSMAAHLEGKGASTLDLTGLSQKNGAVMSHLRVAAHPDQLAATRIGTGSCDLVIGADIVVAGGPEALRTYKPGRTRAIINSFSTPTATFQYNPDFDMQHGDFEQVIEAAIGKEGVDFADAHTIATRLMGNAIAANTWLMGYACQKGWLPVSPEAIERALELNGQSVKMNVQAFRWGRLAGHDWQAFITKASVSLETVEPKAKTLDEAITTRIDFLTKYQNAGYAKRYAKFVEHVRAEEAARVPGSEALTAMVARYLFKLMAYKDEYEVARLYTDGRFIERLNQTFEGDVRLGFNLAPPMIAPKDKETGHLKKREFGAWMFPAFRLLAKARFLRGTPLDVFGYTEERKMERGLIRDYRATIEKLLATLSPANIDLAVQIAEVPEFIRGYGHVKERHLEEAKAREAELLKAWFRGEPEPLKQAA